MGVVSVSRLRYLTKFGCFVEPELVTDRCDGELAVGEEAFDLEEDSLDDHSLGCVCGCGSARPVEALRRVSEMPGVGADLVPAPELPLDRGSEVVIPPEDVFALGWWAQVLGDGISVSAARTIPTATVLRLDPDRQPQRWHDCVSQRRRSNVHPTWKHRRRPEPREFRERVVGHHCDPRHDHSAGSRRMLRPRPDNLDYHQRLQSRHRSPLPEADPSRRSVSGETGQLMEPEQRGPGATRLNDRAASSCRGSTPLSPTYHRAASGWRLASFASPKFRTTRGGPASVSTVGACQRSTVRDPRPCAR